MNPGHLARLTPESVQSATFRPARRGRRGLDDAHVQEFCQRVETELARLASERAELQDEVRRLRQRVLSAGDLAGAPQDDSHRQAASILAQAQKTADRYIAEAQDYSRHLAEHARRRRDEVLADAQAQASRVLAQARQAAGQPAVPQLAVAPGPGGPGLGDPVLGDPVLGEPVAGGPALDAPPAAVTRADVAMMAAPVDLPAAGRTGLDREAL
jgi:DivIVA domain-containing protein